MSEATLKLSGSKSKFNLEINNVLRLKYYDVKHNI